MGATIPRMQPVGYRPPPPPPCPVCGGTGYDDSVKYSKFCPRGCRPWPDAGAVLREGVLRIRRRWWHCLNWKRVGCWLRLGHQLPLVLDYHSLTCKRCGHSWLE